MRRTWLRGRENVHKRYLVHIAGHNLGILMRLLIGAGTPREAAARGIAYLLFVYTEDAVAFILVAAARNGLAILAIAITADPRLIKAGLQQRAAKAVAAGSEPATLRGELGDVPGRGNRRSREPRAHIKAKNAGATNVPSPLDYCQRQSCQ